MSESRLVAGVVIETRPGRAPEAAARLDGVAGLEVQGHDGERRVAAVWSAPEGAQLESLSALLCASDPDVLGVLPTFVGDAGDD